MIHKCHTVIINSSYDDVVAHKFAVNSYISFSRCPLEILEKYCLAFAQTPSVFSLGTFRTTISGDLKCSTNYIVF